MPYIDQAAYILALQARGKDRRDQGGEDLQVRHLIELFWACRRLAEKLKHLMRFLR